jgi:hypothetical protein
MSRLSVPNGLAEDQRLALAYHSARRSWLWPLLAGVSISLIAEIVRLPSVPAPVLHFLTIAFGLIGLMAATYALVTVPAVGRRSIRNSAIAGLMLNVLLVAGGILGLVQRGG